MAYNTNKQLLLQHVPGGENARPMQIGQPVRTQFGLGIITDIRRPSGCPVIDGQISGGLIFDILFPYNTRPIPMAASRVTFYSGINGAVQPYV